MTLFTASITAPLTITPPDGIFRATMKANGGAVQIMGTVTKFKPAVGDEIEANGIVLEDGQSLTLEAWPQAGITATITPAAACDIILAYS